MVGYSPWGRKESETTEQLDFLSLSHEESPILFVKASGYVLLH